jgi:hypothetical protein
MVVFPVDPATTNNRGRDAGGPLARPERTWAHDVLSKPLKPLEPA